MRDTIKATLALVILASIGTMLVDARQQVVLDHGHNLITLYGHLSAVAVVPGQHVQRGQVIGYVGQSGRATGPHVHFEVLLNGEVQNPVKYIEAAR